MTTQSFAKFVGRKVIPGFCFLLISLFSSDAQNITINSAYKKSAPDLLTNFIRQYSLDGNTKNTDTLAELNQLMRCFIMSYSKDSLADFKINPINRVGNEKFILLQPWIDIGFMAFSESGNPFNSGVQKGLYDTKLYPHKNVYKDFLSAGYHHFDELYGQRRVAYSIGELNIKEHEPLIVDTGLINDISTFLSPHNYEHGQKVGFLEKWIKLYPRYIEKNTAQGKVWEYYINYNLLIDNIVFNPSLNKAVIQFSFVDQTGEAFFSKVDNQWVLEQAVDGIQVN